MDHPAPIRSFLEKTADPDNVVINIGPSHPATHGTIQIVAELDGETVKRADVHCGYLHRGFEKEAENQTYHKVIPYTDRLNHCSALNNNFAYAEKSCLTVIANYMFQTRLLRRRLKPPLTSTLSLP